ncbi:MAG TPA: peptide ABC transporter substrate-binding protein [Fimbriimonadaceae bacterium]|nr:peptide ABC transporter substrate-binding protein [Fimbriimonadaceae bacterium]
MRNVVFLVALLAAGCGRGGFSQRTDGKSDNWLRYAMDATPGTLDPALAQDLVAGDLMRQTVEGLVGINEQNEIVPRLAASWSVSEDGLVYTFNIREGVKFHSGKVLTASDFVDTFNRNCDGTFNSPIAKNYLGDIAGVEDKLSGKAPTITGVQASGPLTLSIRLIRPAPYFLGKLTYSVACAIDTSKVPKGSQIKEASQLVGTGPFRLAEYKPEQSARLEAFPDYWDGAPSIEGMELSVVKDPATRLNKFKTGSLDFIGLPQEDVEGMERNPETRENLQRVNWPGLIYLGLNKAVYRPFADPMVRRAFAMAIDKEAIIANILGGVGHKADSILPPGMPGYREGLTHQKFDPAKARSLVKSKLPPVDLVLGGQSTDRRKVAEAIASQLRKNLGVEVSIRQMEMGAYLQRATRKELGFFLGTWFADYLDPENFLSVTLASYGQNRPNYDNPQFSALCLEADSCLDPVKRLKLYQQAEDLALQDAVWIPIYFQQTVLAVNPRVKGIRRNLIDMMPHSRVQLN